MDIDPIERDIARFCCANLNARFPELFPPNAWADAFNLPQDVNAIHDHLIDQTFMDPQQILLMAGWPCQEYSPAGKGRPGPRAAILDKIVAIVSRLQSLQPKHPVAYLFENVALQENFRHEHIRTHVATEVESKVGKAVTFDAANVGSYATRVRNYWTNLASQRSLQTVYNHMHLPHKGNLYDILQPGRHPMPVTHPSKGGHNQPGRIRTVLPTLMSFRQSRAFRPGQPGSIYATQQDAFLEPMAVERELAMGYEAGTTAAPGIDEGERCAALGQAIDLNALHSLFAVARELQTHNLAAHGVPITTPTNIRRPRVATFNLHVATTHTHGDNVSDAYINDLNFKSSVGGNPTDVWLDTEVLDCLKHKQLPFDPDSAKRTLRRAKAYRWSNDRLYKCVQSPDGTETFDMHLLACHIGDPNVAP